MNSCKLDYIPKHLHYDDKPIIDEFNLGEKLYYRCKSEQCFRPYDSISLYDISHNRDFGKEDIYSDKDVLYNIIEETSHEKYDADVIILLIKRIEGKTYSKKILSQDNPDIIVKIELLHRPVNCMYPHSVFQISLNDDIVNKENYNKTLGKRNKTHKNLRSDVRQELSSIIQTRNIDSSNDIEYLEDL